MLKHLLNKYMRADSFTFCDDRLSADYVSVVDVFPSFGGRIKNRCRIYGATARDVDRNGKACASAWSELLEGQEFVRFTPAIETSKSGLEPDNMFSVLVKPCDT